MVNSYTTNLIKTSKVAITMKHIEKVTSIIRIKCAMNCAVFITTTKVKHLIGILLVKDGIPIEEKGKFIDFRQITIF